MASEETLGNVVAMTAPDSGTAAAPGPLAVRVMPAFDFSPRNLTEAMELADRLAESTMVPKSFQGNAGNCLIAMQWGAEIGLKPLQALQNIAVINGKPGLYGDAGKALLLEGGCQIEERDVQETKLAGVASCTITRRGRPPVTRTFSIEDAQTAGLWGKEGPWRTYPYRQMAWRAFWFAARDGAADILRGMGGVEELRDLPPLEERDVTNESSATVTQGQSKSAKLAEQLKKVTLEEVVKAMADANDAMALESAVELAKRLTEADDKIAANAAYHEALARLKATPNGAAPTLAEVRSMLTKAREANSVDDVKVALSLIDKAAGEDDLKKALAADARALIEKMESGK